LKTLFLARSLEIGGAERQIVLLAGELRRRGHDIKVCLFYSRGELGDELRGAGVLINSLEKRGRWDIFRFLFRFLNLLWNEKPEILYSFLPIPNALALFSKFISPKTKVVWGVRGSFIDHSKYDWLTWTAYKVELYLSRFSDLIISNSRAGRDYAVNNGFPSEKTIVIFNGVDDAVFQPNPEAGRSLRDSWCANDNGCLIGLIGRLDPIKGHSVFFRAAAKIVEKRNDVRFVCVGDGPEDYRQNLQNLAEDLGIANKVVWAGGRTDMPAVYNALDLLCSSSHGEGFPNVIGEAMVSGVPCVVTDVGDCAELVGETGIVVPPKDPEALATGLLEMLNRLSENPGLKVTVRKRILERFSKEVLIQKCETALEELL
jgi:glycosyltransferase involved in cell wall biosynthesis